MKILLVFITIIAVVYQSLEDKDYKQNIVLPFPKQLYPVFSLGDMPFPTVGTSMFGSSFVSTYGLF